MERRKLQQVGGGTYTVSVPKEWAKAQSLEAGTTIHLYTHSDGSLLIRTEEKDGEDLTQARIDVEDCDPETLRRSLRAAHSIGFDTITLASAESFTEEQHQAADAATRDLLGMEVVDTGDDEITVQNLLDTSDFSVRQSVVQLQFIALALLDGATDALLAADEDAATKLREREEEADRLFRAVSRQFNRSLSSFEELDRLGLARRELFGYYRTARQLKEICAAAVETARVADTLSEPLPSAAADQVRDLADRAGRVVDDAATVVLTESDIESAHDVVGRGEALLDDIERAERRFADRPSADADWSIAVACGLVRALQQLAQVAKLGADIAGVAIRRDAAE